MAKFDESKIINCLHTDKAEIGKKYYFSDNIYNLKDHVEYDQHSYIGTLTSFEISECTFEKDEKDYWQFIYQYEEPPKKRMTNRQLAEWLAKGNGERISKELGFSERISKELSSVLTTNYYIKDKEDKEVDENIHIRAWDSDEWIEPTVDIYERDCK